MVDRLRDTTESPRSLQRCRGNGPPLWRLGVAGRNCSGRNRDSGSGVPFDFQKDIIDRMRFTQKTGKSTSSLLVAEGVGGVTELAKKIEEALVLRPCNRSRPCTARWFADVARSCGGQ